MRSSLDVYYSLSSPWTFLAWDRLGDLIERHRPETRFHPVDFGLIFSKTGGLPLPKRAPARQRYRLMELERWSKRLGIEMTIEPRFFPVDDTAAACHVLAARASDADVWGLSRAFMAAIWQEERNIAEAATCGAIAAAAGLDAATLADAAPAMAAVRQRESEEAVAKGVFGAPTFVYGETLFWGQDRLDFLEEALAD